MICDGCLHRIFRKYQNGADVSVMTFCDLDGYLISYQLKECSRKEELIKPEPVIESVVEEPIFPPLKEVAKKRGKRAK